MNKAHHKRLLGRRYLGAGDVAELGELLAQHLVVDGVVEVLDVEVDALVARDALVLDALKALLQLSVALSLLLRAAHIDHVTVVLAVVELVHRLEDDTKAESSSQWGPMKS